MDAELMPILKNYVEKNEGERFKLYQDTTGHWTIGVGRNLSINGISHSESQFLFQNDLDYAINFLNKNYEWFKDLNVARKIALIDMCFNLGTKGFAEFGNTIACFKAKEYSKAANCIRFSLYHKKWTERAEKNALMVETGVLPKI